MSPQETDALIYSIYPRHVGKIAALKAIQKAVVFLQRVWGCDSLEARRKLYRTVLAFSRSPCGQQDKIHIPHMATWLNRGSYLDDPEEWNHVWRDNGRAKSSETIDAGRAYLQSLADRLSTSKDGSEETSPKTLTGGL